MMGYPGTMTDEDFQKAVEEATSAISLIGTGKLWPQVAVNEGCRWYVPAKRGNNAETNEKEDG
jgi:hypothetical protein